MMGECGLGELEEKAEPLKTKFAHSLSLMENEAEKIVNSLGSSNVDLPEIDTKAKENSVPAIDGKVPSTPSSLPSIRRIESELDKVKKTET